MTDDLTTARSMAATIARLSAERGALQARLAEAFEEAAKVVEGMAPIPRSELRHLTAAGVFGRLMDVTRSRTAFEAAAAIRALAPAQAGVGGWQDIASAPKDGRWIMVVCDWGDHDNDWLRVVRCDWRGHPDDWLRVVRWDRRRDGFGWATMDPDGMAHGGNIGDNVPTHWQPLPAPPASGDRP